jgi:hypothetical protein
MGHGDVTVEMRVKAGTGISRLRTETQKHLRKMNVRNNMLNGIVVLFRAVCESGQGVAHPVFAEFQEWSGKQGS